MQELAGCGFVCGQVKGCAWRKGLLGVGRVCKLVSGCCGWTGGVSMRCGGEGARLEALWFGERMVVC